MSDRVTRGAAIRQAVVIVVVLLAVGALAGLVWEWVWTPSTGVVYDHDWVPMNAIELQREFSATGWYVVVGTIAGLLAGVVVALLLDLVPLVTLAAVVVGSCLGAWLMSVVGAAVGPADPDHLARTTADGVRLPAALAVSGHSPLAALPVGALLGLIVVFLGVSARARHERSEPAEHRSP